MISYAGPGRVREDSLASVLASGALARVVTHFVLHPESSLHFQGLRRVTGLPTRSLQRELARLGRLGLLRRERDGRLVRYRADPEHPRWQALRELVREFAAPVEILRSAVAQVPGIDAAFIFGSYARGAEILPGSDVDVFLVGKTLDQGEQRLTLARELLEAAGLLGREVNAVRYTPQRLAARQRQESRFVREVLRGEKQWLVGGEAALRQVVRAWVRESR